MAVFFPRVQLEANWLILKNDERTVRQECEKGGVQPLSSPKSQHVPAVHWIACESQIRG